MNDKIQSLIHLLSIRNVITHLNNTTSEKVLQLHCRLLTARLCHNTYWYDSFSVNCSHSWYQCLLKHSIFWTLIKQANCNSALQLQKTLLVYWYFTNLSAQCVEITTTSLNNLLKQQCSTILNIYNIVLSQSINIKHHQHYERLWSKYRMNNKHCLL